jgi:hypothetical protein
MTIQYAVVDWIRTGETTIPKSLTLKVLMEITEISLKYLFHYVLDEFRNSPKSSCIHQALNLMISVAAHSPSVSLKFINRLVTSLMDWEQIPVFQCHLDFLRNGKRSKSHLFSIQPNDIGLKYWRPAMTLVQISFPLVWTKQNVLCNDTLYRIFSFLDCKSLHYSTQVCKLWNETELRYSKTLWRNLLYYRWPDVQDNEKNSKIRYKGRIEKNHSRKPKLGQKRLKNIVYFCPICDKMYQQQYKCQSHCNLKHLVF